jgi:hypothetical protein
MDKKPETFRLSYESDGIMEKKHTKQPSSSKEKKSEKDFFNTTQASE